jgi:peptide/nickel transport system permease protein
LTVVLAATIVALIIGIPLGLIAGMRAGSAWDSGSRTVASIGIAIPNFWLAVILVSLLAVHWRIFPPSGFTPIQTSFTTWARDVTLPALALGFLLAASIARQLRRALVDTLQENYVRTAWAKGGTVRTVVGRHALKNAAMPVITVVGVQIGYLLGGAVIIENIFSIPGLGTYMQTGIVGHDLPVVQAVALVFVIFQMSMSLLVDISYGFLNPKVRVG